VEAEEASRAAATSRGVTESSAEGDIVSEGGGSQGRRRLDNNHNRRKIKCRAGEIGSRLTRGEARRSAGRGRGRARQSLILGL